MGCNTALPNLQIQSMRFTCFKWIPPLIQKMKFPAFVTVIALSLIIIAPVKAITWGEPDGGKHPQVGAMVVGLGQLCSSTLIYPNIFLTAGHCTDYVQSGGIAVYVTFDEDSAIETSWLPVKEVITHPEYSWTPASNRHDVGVLILEENVSGIYPATLPEKGFLDEKKKAHELRKGKEEADFTVVGYGGTLDWPPPSVAYEGKRQFAKSEYQALLRSWLKMSRNRATDDGGSCSGDSGGPTFWIDPETGVETDKVVAITFWGDVPCVATGIAYRIDTSDALDFIEVMAGTWLLKPMEP